MSRKITFVTTNKGKVASCQKYFKDSDVELEICNYELIEPRTDDVKEIATSKVKQAYDYVKRPCIAIDTGFFVNELNGFPRAFVNFALDTIKIEGILKLMEGKEDRTCYFRECLAYYDGRNIEYFECKIPGILSKSIEGRDTNEKWSNLWYVFVPSGYSKTLAQMSSEERDERRKSSEPEAFQLFSNWYLNNM